MHLEFLVEEPSAEAALQNLLPKILGTGVSFNIHPHSGKTDLLAKLPGRLSGYRSWLPDDWGLVVLIDEDREDCIRLKRDLEREALRAGLTTQSSGHRGSFEVLNRVAVEELEAWFFGDIPALTTAYPGISPHLGAKRPFRDPDAIKGGTWEALERVLQRAGHHRACLRKI